MRILIDTNVLLRSAEPSHSQYAVSDASVASLVSRGEELCVLPQVLYEFWVASTRPLTQNGLGWTTATARSEITRIEQMFRLIDESAGVYAQWRQLVAQHDTKGKSAHDAHLVAAMMVHGISTILTFNNADFVRYSTINAITPDGVLPSTDQP